MLEPCTHDAGYIGPDWSHSCLHCGEPARDDNGEPIRTPPPTGTTVTECRKDCGCTTEDECPFVHTENGWTTKALLQAGC